MTIEELSNILALAPIEAVKALQVSSYTVPDWKDLEEEYDPTKHKIMDKTLYPEKLNDNNTDDFERTTLALQKLAVRRISQAMFATPVQRTWSYEAETERTQKAIEIIEEIYRVRNNIDAANIERAKKNNASCQLVTIWTSKPVQNDLVKGEPVSFKLTHKSYSPMDDYNIYAINDNYEELLVVSIGYTKDNVEYLDVYTKTEPPQFIRYSKDGDWALADLGEGQTNPKPLTVFPAVYTYLTEPVWGGEAGTNKVEQLEKMESYQGLYIVRNALPTFTMDMGDTSGMQSSSTEESASDSRRIIKVGKGGSMQDVTWEGAEKAVTARYNRIRNAFFEENQIPDISFANLINSNTSAENKQLLFADVKAKAIDLGGEWQKFFYEEIRIVLEFAKVMFPSYVNEFSQLSARTTLVPYDINTKKDRAEFVAAAGDSMSLETRIRELNTVDNVDNEADLIRQEQSAQANQGI